MATLDEITKEKQRLGEALARVDSQREKLASQLSELEAAEGVLSRYGKDTRVAKTARRDADRRNEAGRSSARARAATGSERKTRGRQAQLIEPQRSGAITCNRQNAAGNHRSMQRRSPEPYRCRHCPAQAGWPHRTARREALRQTPGGSGGTRRGLTRRTRRRRREDGGLIAMIGA